MISPPDALIGVQRPRVLRVPEMAVSTAGKEAADLAASAGLILDDWQRFALDVALGERSDGRWAAFEVGLIVGRQNGKGSIIEARELAGLFLFEEQLILHSAHEFKTANEAFLRVKTLIERTPDLARKVRQIRRANEVSIETKSGSRLLFVARSGGSGRGFSGDCVILDEAFNLGDEAMGALLPTLSARPNPQIWYTSSAPKATSSQLHAVRRRALSTEDDSRLAFLEWSIDQDVDAADDPRSWAKANPSMGIRISEEFIRSEIRALPAAEFARERLGVPDPEVGAGHAAVPAEVWGTLADPASEWIGVPVGVVDVSPDGRTSMVLAGMRADGLRHVELVDNRAGTSWVKDRREELSARWSVAEWVRDPNGPAVELPGEWRDLKAREYAEACAGFLRDALEDAGLRWRCPADLESALSAARANAMQTARGDGAWSWSRRKSGVDISPWVAMTVGWWAAAESEGKVPSLW